ncbi:SusC/RagA family TonB-linked outer membrane protein [Dysgonomonas massiliensis]|uniref:SusC/RagA family TonB-linked outer membrane protein n=1 Tax=Dysgonomonas massiliensis TaxID=2040292 RepID=UPI000C756A4D|nr:SusC/RagA family TonB-linked outer membrane protein [Dysgonomonas massiliensis]
MKIINCLFRQFRKITTYVILLLFLSINLNAQDQKIKFSKEQMTIRTAFEEIEKQTNYTIAYNESLVDVDKTIVEKTKDLTLQQALTNILKNTDVTFKIQGKQILIVKEVTQSAPKEYKGVIVDEAGETIIGASVSIKGNRNIGTITDIDGAFTLKAPVGSILLISYVGFIPQEIVLNENETTLDILLKENNRVLDEVVVTALGIKRSDKALTYNVQKLKGDDLLNTKEVSVPNALVGKIAGVTVNQGASGIGGSTKVVMRGSKSVSDGGNNNALYVLDGIPLPDLLPRRGGTSNGQYGGVDEGDGISSLNMEDFEEITVLTGPSAAALYGGQAANGVIMLTSKQGGLKDGKPRITFSHYTDFYTPALLPELQNSYGSRPGEFSSWGPKLANNKNYDPADFFDTGVSFSNSVGLQFGNEKNKTYISLAAYNADGIIHNNKIDRYNVTYNGMYDITNNLTLAATMMYANKRSQNMVSQGEYYNPIVPIYLFPRGDEIDKYKSFERYDPDRGFATQFWPYGDQKRNIQNPYWITRRNFNTYKDNRLILGANLKYTFNDWINISARYRIDRNTKLNELKNYASTNLLLTSGSDKGSFLRATDENKSEYADILVNIQKQVSDFEFVVNAGASLTRAKNNYTANSNKLEFGAPLATVPNKFTLDNLSPEPQYQAGGRYENQSVFLSASIDYKRKIFLDLTGRAEWTSMMANTPSYSDFYPSVGLSTIITEWIKIPENILSFSKFRVSYAEVGNVPLGLIGVTSTSYPISPGGGVSINADLPITDLKFERTRSYEVGLTSRFLNNKLGFDITYYNSNTFDQLFKFRAPVGSGYENFYVNAGKVNNYGIEAAIDADLKFGNVGYSPMLTFTYNKNKIKELVKNEKNPISGDVMNYDRIEPSAGLASFRNYLDVGGSVGDMFVNSFVKDGNGYVYVNPNTMQMLVDNQSLIYAGNSNPDYSIGFNNTFTYKGFSLSFLVDARIGGKVVSATQGILDSYGASKASAIARDNGGVLVNGVRMDAESYYQQVGGGAGVLSNYVYDATNIRLREASLSYMFAKPLICGVVKNLTISLTGRNLFMIYNKAPFDPQLTSSVGTFYQGIDYFLMPNIRSFGLNVRFTL